VALGQKTGTSTSTSPSPSIYTCAASCGTTVLPVLNTQNTKYEMQLRDPVGMHAIKNGDEYEYEYESQSQGQPRFEGCRPTTSSPFLRARRSGQEPLVLDGSARETPRPRELRDGGVLAERARLTKLPPSRPSPMTAAAPLRGRAVPRRVGTPFSRSRVGGGTML